MKNRKSLPAGRRGFSAVSIIFIMVIVLMVSLTITTLLTSNSNIVASNQRSLRAFYIAEAGFEYYMKELTNDPDWATPPASISNKDFSYGKFSITTSGASKDQIIVTSVGTITSGGLTFTRSIRTKIDRNPWSFTNDYAIYPLTMNTGLPNTNIRYSWITGGMYFGNGVDIGTNWWQPSYIDGDVYSTGSINKTWSTTVTGDRNPNSAMPSNIPILNTQPYDSLITIANSFTPPPSGITTWTGSRTLSGYTYINGDLVIDARSKVFKGAVPPTVVVSGNIIINGGTVGNRTVIDDNVNFISGGNTVVGGVAGDLNNYTTIGKGNILYSTDGFVARGALYRAGGDAPGEGTAFITPKDFDGSLGGDMYGLIYCGGTLDLTAGTRFQGNIVAGYVDNLTVSRIILDGTIVNYSGIPGLPSTTQVNINDWNEVY